MKNPFSIYSYNKIKDKEKKGSIEITLNTLVRLLASTFMFIIVLSLFVNFLSTEEYNKDVAIDVMYSIDDFINYKSEKHQNLNYACYDTLKLSYLSNAQLFTNEGENYYVIALTHNDLSLITFRDFQKLYFQESSNSPNIIDRIPLEKNIDLNNFKEFIVDGNELGDDVVTVFFVPSVAIENSIVELFQGDSKMGYYIFYFTQEGNVLTIKPGEGNVQSLFKAIGLVSNQNMDTTLNSVSFETYDFGYYKTSNVESFGPIKKTNQFYDSLKFCGSKPEEDTSQIGADSSVNTVGILCSFDIEENEYEMNLYWNNGYVMSFNGDLTQYRFNDFTSLFSSKHPELFSDESRREDLNDQSDEIKTSLEQSINDFYDVENLECRFSDDMIIDKVINFEDYFYKISDEDLINYIKSLDEETVYEKTFSSENLDVNNCKYSDEEIEYLDRELCNYIIYYDQEIDDDEGVKTNVASYIQRSGDNSGFYIFKDPNFIRVQNVDTEPIFSLADKELSDDFLSLKPDSCKWYYLRCRKKQDFIQFNIEQFFFNNEVNSLSFYIDSIDFDEKVNILPTFDRFFTQKDSSITSWKNNDILTVDSVEYMTRFQYLDIGFSHIESPSNTEPRGVLDNDYDEVDFFLVEDQYTMNFVYYGGVGNEQLVSYKLNPDLLGIPNQDTISFRKSSSLEDDINYELSFEQVLYAMYSSQDLSRLGSIEQEIREGRFKLINYKNIVPGDSSFSNYNIAYILVTESSMVPLFYTFTDEDIVKHNLIYSTTFNQASLSDELNLNILFPKKIEGDINFITIDVTINVQDLEVMN